MHRPRPRHLIPAAALFLLLPATATPLLAQRVFVIYSGPLGYDPRISSDGKVVAFYGGGLITARPDGSGTVNHLVGGGVSTALSGDGRLLVYDLTGEIRALDTVTGVKWTVCNCDAAMVAVSDDGSTIAYQDGGSFALHVIHPDGSGHRDLGVHGRNCGPSLTADGRVVVFEDEAPPYDNPWGIHRINSDGTGLAVLTDPNDVYHVCGRVSGDGSVITYESYGLGFHAMDGDGSNPRDLLTGILSGTTSKEGADHSDVSLDGRVGVISALEGLFVAATDGSWVRQIHSLSGEVDISGTGDVVITSPPWASDDVLTIGVPGISPGEMMDMEMSSDGQTLTWATRPSAYSHNVYRARWSSPGAHAPGSTGDCLQSSITATRATDANSPLPREAFGYFVTGENAWGEGPAGTTIQGVERIPATSCPDADSDGDAFPDVTDVCPLVVDPNQADPDGDGLGSLCDNCPGVANEDQFDFDHDGIGNACEP